MCYTAMLPTTSQTSKFNQKVMNVTYVFNRWLKMLHSYERLDPTAINRDFSAISKALRCDGIPQSVKIAVATCRDCALAPTAEPDRLISALTNALRLLCAVQEDSAVTEIKQHYADQGMTERYRPLSKRLAREKIRKLGKSIAYTDVETDDAKTTKLVRRIVEKRAAQAVYRNAGKGAHQSNRFRQSVRRATSFSIYNTAFTEYDQQKRVNRTHWKVVEGKFGKMLKSKRCFSTYEEALEACQSYTLCYPNDSRPVSPYTCNHCGKWHIGHANDSREEGKNMHEAG